MVPSNDVSVISKNPPESRVICRWHRRLAGLFLIALKFVEFLEGRFFKMSLNLKLINDA